MSIKSVEVVIRLVEVFCYGVGFFIEPRKIEVIGAALNHGMQAGGILDFSTTPRLVESRIVWRRMAAEAMFRMQAGAPVRIVRFGRRR